MAYIHSRNFIHRDLNSQNVVLTKDMEAKICDFGSARRMGENGFFNPSMIEGSPSTMSPEQLTGGRLSLKSDVWQMGVLLWEVFAMRHPWVGVCDINDHVALTELVVRRGVRLPPLEKKTLPAAVHPRMVSLIQRTFQSDAAARPDMLEVCEALTAMHDSAFTPTKPTGAPAAAGALAPRRLAEAAPASAQTAVARRATGAEPPYAVGDAVEYHSSTFQSWIAAKVLAVNRDGTLELDVRSEAHPSLVRRPPTAGGSGGGGGSSGGHSPIAAAAATAAAIAVSPHAGGQAPPAAASAPSGPMDAEAPRGAARPPAGFLGGGDEVEYWSTTNGCWIAAVVLRLNPDGTLNLDVKEEASPGLVRLRGSGPPGPPGAGAAAHTAVGVRQAAPAYGVVAYEPVVVKVRGPG